MYFEHFFLQPVKINVSFARTEASSEDSVPRSRNILAFVFDVFTMAIGNIHDAPIRMSALELNHPIVTYSQLLSNIMTFYSQEVVGQIHKVIGSADVLGNPVGLFNSVSSGVWDLFYEPIQGFEITRPQDFGIGLAKGGASLVKKTVFGFSDTLSKFTGSIGKGLSVVTLDSKFQEQRRMANVRNKPKHAVYGVTQGITSFARSVGSGVEGLVAKPMEGAEKEGVAGFFKGLGKGVVGVVTKPIIGVFDLASNVSEGIRNTTTVFEMDLDRQRLPRFIGKDGILKVFDPREALGLNLLKSADNGAYFHEEYLAHLDLRNEDLFALVTNVRIVMIRRKRMKKDWDITYDEVQLVRVESGGITLVQKGRSASRARIIPCPDIQSASWLCKKIEKGFMDYLARHKPLD